MYVGEGGGRLAGQIIFSKLCSFSPETEFVTPYFAI